MRSRAAALRPERSAPIFVDQGVEVERFASGATVERGREIRSRLELGDGPVLLYAGHLGPASDLAEPAAHRVRPSRIAGLV